MLFQQILYICAPAACFFAPSEAVVNDLTGENRTGAGDVSASQHVMVCALKELGSLVQSLSATASPLIQEPSVGERPEIQTCFFDTDHRCLSRQCVCIKWSQLIIRV